MSTVEVSERSFEFLVSTARRSCRSSSTSGAPWCAPWLTLTPLLQAATVERFFDELVATWARA
ncbi:MAG TPA: hypothetical protein VGO80_02730 [Solirubrobacteraceae bacterium]|nr:hypothetical protein [Solirubrobacteraceae bacterium]